MSALEEGSSDGVFQQNGSHSSAAELPTLFHRKYECKSEWILSVVTKFTDIQLRASRQTDRQIVFELVDFFSWYIIWTQCNLWYITNPVGCKNGFPKRTGRMSKDDGIHIVFVRSSSSKIDGYSTLYVKHLTWGRSNFAGKRTLCSTECREKVCPELFLQSWLRNKFCPPKKKRRKRAWVLWHRGVIY